MNEQASHDVASRCSTACEHTERPLSSAPAISVVIPVYNVEACLPETLDSILAQTFENWECLCIDDGSTDGSADVVRHYAAKDSRIRLLSQSNAGASAARNRGIDEARGTYLFFVDSDDLTTPDMMDVCFQRMQEDHSDLCAFEADTFYSDPSIPREAFCRFPDEDSHVSFAPEERPTEAFQLIPACPWNKMYRVDFLRSNALRFPTSLKRSEDTPFGTLCVAAAKRISCVRKTLYLYRQNRPGSQMSSLSSPKHYYRFLDAGDIIWNELRQRGLLATFGIGALQLILGNACWYHDFLTPCPRMWVATRRLQNFLKQGLTELRAWASARLLQNIKSSGIP